MRKNTKIDIICSVFLGILLIGWIVFLDSSVAVSTAADGEGVRDADGIMVSESQKTKTADMIVENFEDTLDDVPAGNATVTPAEVQTPADEPIEAQTPTDEPIEAQTPTDEPIEVQTPTDEPIEVQTSTDEPLEAQTPTDEPEVLPEPTPAPDDVEPEALTLPDMVVAKVEDFVNIRAEASTTADIVGKLEKDNYGIVIEKSNDWTKIKSGDITGYVSNTYLYSGEKALQILKEKGAFKVEISVSEANVRIEPNTDCSILMTVFCGDRLIYIPDKSNTAWYEINTTDGNIGYISASLVTPIVDFATAN